MPERHETRPNVRRIDIDKEVEYRNGRFDFNQNQLKAAVNNVGSDKKCRGAL